MPSQSSERSETIQSRQTSLGQQLRELGIIPVLRMDDPSRTALTARALLDGGLPAAEITFRTKGAAEAIRRMQEYPEILTGAGTVRTPAQVREAGRAGAVFIVSPGLSRPVAEACREEGLPYYPGVCTPSEVDLALQWNLSTLKFFPAEASGGVASIQALKGPYPSVEWIPTGGIREENLRSYLDWPSVLACGGSWMVPPKLIQEGQQELLAEKIGRAAFLASGLHPRRILLPEDAPVPDSLRLMASLTGLPLLRSPGLSQPTLLAEAGDSLRAKPYLQRRSVPLGMETGLPWGDTALKLTVETPDLPGVTGGKSHV